MFTVKIQPNIPSFMLKNCFPFVLRTAAFGICLQQCFLIKINKEGIVDNHYHVCSFLDVYEGTEQETKASENTKLTFLTERKCNHSKNGKGLHQLIFRHWVLFNWYFLEEYVLFFTFTFFSLFMATRKQTDSLKIAVCKPVHFTIMMGGKDTEESRPQCLPYIFIFF